MKSITPLSTSEFKIFQSQVAPKHQDAFSQLRQTIIDHLAYVVPHSIFPDGYHCNPESPLPFISIASQKNFIGFYHMGLYTPTKNYSTGLLSNTLAFVNTSKLSNANFNINCYDF